MAEAEAELRKKIIAIQRDPDLTAQEKARKCQDLMTFGAAGKPQAGAQCYSTGGIYLQSLYLEAHEACCGDHMHSPLLTAFSLPCMHVSGCSR
jgi:hypothetical protein